MKRIKDLFWPLVGIIAVGWSLKILYSKLRIEAAGEAGSASWKALENAGLLESLGIIAAQIGQKLGAIPLSGYLLAVGATLFAYWALAWYDRIALIHLNRTKGISWLFITVCSFVTYAISHNIGGSVFSGGMVRYRAYTSKGLSPAEVAVLVALCSFTFGFGTILLGGVVLVYEPEIVQPLAPWMSLAMTRLIGFGMIAFCVIYTLGSWLQFKPMVIRNFKLEYPRLNVVWRQWIAAPMELLGAAGIIYFVLPDAGNPGFMVVLGAFLLSFSAGLLFQVPGGIGVMEAVFLKVMPGMPATEVFAALLVWRLCYLIIPLAVSLPIVLAFEKAQLRLKKEQGGQ
ncbi:MAG: lysylphosphatidylglycerol synthase domain-containing protein [Proteobacteria bacterium]|nr:lysylphosphatidylglycerol synthase domain-containing protein [Pseudomonadota bacterium]